jgi:DNA-binding transcriptional LysR family regulator
MQQPPLSQRIRRSSANLVCSCFIRKARGVELTAAGRAFLDNARAVLAQLDHMFETTRRTARGEEGRISVGMCRRVHFIRLCRVRSVRSVKAIRSYPCVGWRALRRRTVGMLRNEQIDVASSEHTR